MTHHTLQTTRTAHYYQLGEAGTHIRRYWLVCHGYAQLADEFLESFRALDDGQTLVIAPEGLNYFYKKGFGGAPGATWMTKQHRLDEIRDYTAYLQTLHASILAQLPGDVEIVCLGFSQGVATIFRWLLHYQPACQHVLVWAGMLPDDEDFNRIKPYWMSKGIHFIYGDQDPFITAERVELLKEGLKILDWPVQIHQFEGVHEINSNLLVQLSAGM